MKHSQGMAVGVLLAAMMASPLAWSAEPAKKAPPKDPTEDAIMMSGGFLSGHPDLRYRLNGQWEYQQGKYEDAFSFFKRGAYYGDKPSQGMVAEMMWTAKGVPLDRPQAYAWMDLAAERGYDGFIKLREHYWASLNEEERKQAVEVGQDIYAKYGDAAAEQRLATAIRREQAKQAGSRTGFAGNLKIYVPGPGGSYMQIDGTQFYDKKYWDPKQYRAMQDEIWMKPMTGTVSVGEAQEVKDGKSRVPETAPQVDAPEPQTPQVDESRLGTKPPR